nr:unnamed protein product [Callosobruchus analis]
MALRFLGSITENGGYAGTPLKQKRAVSTSITRRPMTTNATSQPQQSPQISGSCAPGTSALALVYSAVEYASPLSINSVHTNRIDPNLNETLRIITGTIRPTPVHWLPVLSHIPPPTHHLISGGNPLF